MILINAARRRGKQLAGRRGGPARRKRLEAAMAVHKLEAVRPSLVPASSSYAVATPAHRTIPWRWALAALAVVAAASGGAWYLLKPVEVVLGTASVGRAVDAVYASGVVEYVRQARIAPVVTAPILRVAVEEGQDVRAGQALAQLDEGPQLWGALQLEAQAAQARAVADRARRLLDAGFGARAADEDAQAGRAAAEAAATSARERLKDYRISAPFAGRVLRRDAEPGERG
jgi:multidrug efflux pump subunit AcrA (membrane-fusion protein)